MLTHLPSVVVVGGGAMGSSAARELAERGHEVTVLEQFDAVHARGSSHGSSRIVRLVYADPSYVRLAQAARALWDELQLVAEHEVFRQCGGVDHGPREQLEPTTCLYAGHAEDDFTLDRVGSITVAAGFSGHGFKFVPLVGRIVADLVAGTARREPRFSISAHQSTT